MFNRRYNNKLVSYWELDAYRLIIGAIIVSALVGYSVKKVDAFADRFRWHAPANPLISSKNIEVEYIEIDTPDENIPSWVQQYVDQYFYGYKRSEMYMIMHCLLHRESGHSEGDKAGHGDGGKAGGSLQFHQPTWVRMRSQMLKQGLIQEIGSRYDTEQSIHTTVWAIRNGYALEWGPILRDSKGSDFAACQVPSWYK